MKEFNMGTIVSLKLSELSELTFKRLKKILRNATDSDDAEIKIFVQSDNANNKKYFDELNDSINQFEHGDIKTFAMEDFVEYAKSKSIAN